MMSLATNVWARRLLLIACLVASAVFFSRGRWLVGVAWLGASVVPLIAGQPRGRRRYFILAAVILSAVTTVTFVVGLDLYLHYRFATAGGYNVWGYRGPVAGKKKAGERRLVMLGGSVAFGFGVRSDETIPFYLERQLNLPGSTPPTRIINLGWNSEGAYSLKFTLKDYEYLDYEGAILYSGYNDLVFNNQVFRHESSVFRLTGYLPILPVIPIREWLRLNNLSETSGRVVFRPTLSDRYAAEAADTALRISQTLDRELARFAPPESRTERPTDPSCEQRWAYYCRAVRDAIETSIAMGKQTFVVTEPYKTEQHHEQQAALQLMLKRFHGHPLVHAIDMGPSVDLRDTRLCYDGLHLTPAGNAQVAARLAPELRKALDR